MSINNNNNNNNDPIPEGSSNPEIIRIGQDPINYNYGTEEVAIEPPRFPGNYSARKSNKWVSNSSEDDDDNDAASGAGNKGANVTKEEKNGSNGNNRNKRAERKKSFDKDEIHSTVSPFKVSPGQLYSTDSGRLFHAGKLLICLCGLPGRGKTHLSVSLTRYLRWLGVTTQVFHFDDFRRQYLKEEKISPVFFSQKPDDEKISKFKEELIEKCVHNIEDFLGKDKGQVAIYDAINGIAKNRIALQERFSKINVKVIFIESLIDNDKLLTNSLKDAIKSPDYKDWEVEKARVDFNKRIQEASLYYEIINDVEPKERQVLSYIKSINFGERLVLNKSEYGYLINRITFFLLNTRIKKGSIFFARCGDTKNKNNTYKVDPLLSEEGLEHAKLLEKSLVDYLVHKSGNVESELILKKKIQIWTSARRRTVQTASVFVDKYDISLMQRSELTQLNPGKNEGFTEEETQQQFPIEYELFQKDPYHVRFPRGESYHDVAVRLEPLILEMERNTKNILIIGHESVLRVLYGYLMNCASNDIPYLEFPPDEIVEVSYNAYANTSTRIKI